jgi:hypothetical protein
MKERLALGVGEIPRRTFVPTTDASIPRPTFIPAPRRTGLFSGWGVKL